ncbi:MAG: hypothetical protein L0177_20795 [Chloroflexi bacterium]|nr:hypothetical protein [Chloroflexota bacterium]
MDKRADSPEILSQENPTQHKRPFVEPKLAFIEPKLTRQGKVEHVTGFVGSFSP